MAIGCLLFAGVCSLGFTAGSRDMAVVKQTAAADAYADKRAIATAARTELAQLATIKVPSKAVLDRRRELARLLAEPRGGKAAPASAGHDSQAAAVSAYFIAAGYPVTVEAAGRWINFGTVAFLELAAARSLTIAAALRPTRRQPVGAPAATVVPAEPQLPAKPEKPATASPERRQRHNDDDPLPPPPTNKGKGGRPRAVIPAEALARLKAKGGRINGTLGELGKAIGSRSRSTTHRVLHQLAGAGLLTMTATPRGVAVALA
jgi:hypothetical protein